MSLRMSRKSEPLSYEEALKLADEHAEEDKRNNKKKMDELMKFKQKKDREQEEAKRRTLNRIEELQYMAKQTSQRSAQTRERVQRRKEALLASKSEDGSSRKRSRGKKISNEGKEEQEGEPLRGRYKGRNSSQSSSKNKGGNSGEATPDEERAPIPTKGKYSSQRDSSDMPPQESQHSSMPAKIKVKSLSHKDAKPSSESLDYREIEEDTDYDEDADSNNRQRRPLSKSTTPPLKSSKNGKSSSKGTNASRNDVKSVISEMFGRSYYDRARDESDDDMEVSAAQIRREEMSSARIGRMEDEEEEERLAAMSRAKTRRR